MFYLYLKTHNTTGLQYLGQTIKDPFVYQGSGKHWKRHINKHGYDVTTVVLYETPYREEISELGLYFSDLWNIVESGNFANLIIESGDGFIHSEYTKKRIGESNKGKTHSEESKRKMSESRKGKHTKEDNSFFGKSHSDETKLKLRNYNLGKTHSEESKRKMSESHLGFIHSDETKLKMSNNHTGGVVNHSDETKLKMSMRHLGKIHTIESKQKISNSLKGKPKSEEHKRKLSGPQTNTTCPHCGKIGGSNAMKRYHFENCKHLA